MCKAIPATRDGLLAAKRGARARSEAFTRSSRPRAGTVASAIEAAVWQPCEERAEPLLQLVVDLRAQLAGVVRVVLAVDFPVVAGQGVAVFAAPGVDGHVGFGQALVGAGV